MRPFKHLLFPTFVYSRARLTSIQNTQQIVRTKTLLQNGSSCSLTFVHHIEKRAVLPMCATDAAGAKFKLTPPLQRTYKQIGILRAQRLRLNYYSNVITSAATFNQAFSFLKSPTINSSNHDRFIY